MPAPVCSPPRSASTVGLVRPEPDEPHPGRDDLARWWAARPVNYYTANPNLRAVLTVRAGPARTAAMEPRLADFGAAVSAVIDPAVGVLEHHRQLPAHVAWDGIGRHREDVEFHPAHRQVGQAVWASGMMAVNRGGTGAFEQAALFYLLSHVGEGGQACPVVCTAGLTRALEHRGSAELQQRYLAGLSQVDYDRGLRGSQFLTEIQGGSDVGANLVAAVPDPDEPGAWRLSGEKWFCSVADADLFAVTARADGGGSGTRGLGCFLVPRLLEGGALNGFRIRRLKDKLGTRCLASAEIDFAGARCWPIGAAEDGFRVAVEDLLNTSRWLNAVGSTGIMRRAYLEASSFASHRRAFGRPVGAFPAVREQLATMKVEEQAALASTMALTALLERVDGGRASDEENDSYRVLVNANKYATSMAATDVVHRGIEVLGGNGTIEDFSPLPRLYRDAIVYESWEGAHNVLCAQVLRDCGRLRLLDGVLGWIGQELRTAGGGPDVDGVATALEALAPRLRRSLADRRHGAVHFRRQLDRLVRVVQASCLLAEATGQPGGPKEEVATFFVRRHLVPGYDPEDDPGWPGLVDAVLDGDAG